MTWTKLWNGIKPLSAAVVIAMAILLVVAPVIFQRGVEAASSANRLTELCFECTGTGAQAQALVKGGISTFQATCTGVFPDALDFECRDADLHDWDSVEGFTTMVTNGRQSTGFFLGDQTRCRINITDAAPAHSCYVTVTSVGK